MVDLEGPAPYPEAAPYQPRFPDDLRAVLAADPVAQTHWDELPEKLRKEWLQYLSEGREPARRAIRLANLLMSITDE